MKDIIKRHNIRVYSLKRPGHSEVINETLGKVLGVNEVHADSSGRKVNVTYNLKFIDYKTIEKKLGESGYPPRRGFLQTIKRGFINFTERNEISRQRINYKSQSRRAY